MTVFKTIEELIEENNSFITAIPNNMGINLVSVKGIEYDYQEDGQIKEMKIIFIPSKEELKQICDNCKIEISKYGCACGGKPKQETLEEAADKYSKKSNTYVFQESHKRDFIAGAKWQQENSNINALYFEIDALKREIKSLKHQQEQYKNKFREEYIIEILMEYDYLLVNEGKLNSVGNIKKWFEQFKNK